jgi:hypothetical protein
MRARSREDRISRKGAKKTKKTLLFVFASLWEMVGSLNLHSFSWMVSR